MSTATSPRFANRHTSAHALGLACDTTHVYYASMVDAPNACKSLWASLVNSSTASHLYCTPWATRNLFGQENLKSIYQPLSGSSYTHLIVLAHHPELLLAVAPTATAATDEAQRHALLTQHLPSLYRRFTSLLNAHTATPVLDEWAEELWSAGLSENAITTLEAYGDCLGAWWIDLNFDWTKLTSTLLRQTVLTF
jgi:hypothetical protein